MFLKGVFKSQWTSLWGQQPSVEQQSEEDDGADAGDSADDAVMQLTQASPNVLTRDSPQRKRPRSASDEAATCNPLPSQQHNNSVDHHHHHHSAVIADGSRHGHPNHRAPSVHATESPCTPNTVRSSLSKYVQHSSLPQDCAAASALDDVLGHPSMLVGAEVQLWHAPHHHQHAAKVAVDARHTVAPIPRPFPSVARVPSSSLPPPQAAEVCHVLSHIWFRMVRDHQRASPGYVITDEDCWRSTVQAAARRYPVKEGDAIGTVAATLVVGVDFHTRGAGPRGSTVHNAAGVATADDEDRWIPALRQLSQRMLSHHAQRSSSNSSSADYHHHHLCAAPPPPFANSTTVCSDTFDSSIDAVRSLMLHMIEAETYIDPSTWLVAFIYAERMHQQYVASHGHQHSGGRTCRHTDPSAPLWRQTERGGETTTPTEFVFYRRHELRILFALFTLAVKQLSDLYVTVRNLHRCLPSFITSYQHHAGSAQRSGPPAAVLPLSLRQKFPHIAQRLEASMVAESTMMSRQYAEHDGPLTPPYSLDCAGRMEVAILRGGLGYRTLVREHDMNELLSQYASPSEAALLMRYMQHRIQAKR